MLSFSISILILGLVGAAILRRHLHEAKLLRLREIRHREKITAMERNLPVPDADDAGIDSLLAGDEGAGANLHRSPSTNVHYVRLAALALGLTCFFGGAGAIPGLYLLSDPEVRGTWPLGLVPLFAGAGLLIFVRLSRGLAKNLHEETESP